ncbi:Crp/Fnr family transcriptional regulator [Paenibacillus koleovorans]|uniref:Crp/Fnr family transcriptional regulator n=1 Tax=Paenibacillus koleovorans TaxID=121608 RepID=UPI000FDB28E5|nr:Crp/Fnr family transcriptional regulator [Paenibacillus koleovorans]
MKEIVTLVRNVPLFQHLRDEELAMISSLFMERKYKKNAIIFFEGDSGDDLFLIKSGTIKIYRIDNTKQITLALFRAGDFFGEMSLVQRGFTRSANAETLEPSVLYTLNRATFYECMEKAPSLCMKLLEVTMNRLRKANEQIHDLTFLDVRTRILKTVLQLSLDHGELKQGQMQISVKLTHQEIANMVGTVRESVTKVLQELQDEGVISVDNKMITVIDMPTLKKKVPQ